jgi:hypothetical protein
MHANAGPERRQARCGQRALRVGVLYGDAYDMNDDARGERIAPARRVAGLYACGGSAKRRAALIRHAGRHSKWI